MMIILSVSNTIFENVIETPSNRKTLAGISNVMFLTNTINQFLSRKSNRDNLIEFFKIELLNSIFNRSSNSKSPSDRTVLRFANVFTKVVFSKTTIFENRVLSYCRFQSFTFHTFVCSIKYYLLYPIQL